LQECQRDAQGGRNKLAPEGELIALKRLPSRKTEGSGRKRGRRKVIKWQINTY